MLSGALYRSSSTSLLVLFPCNAAVRAFAAAPLPHRLSAVASVASEMMTTMTTTTSTAAGTRSTRSIGGSSRRFAFDRNSSPNGEEPNSQQPASKREGQTGWNHNQPSDASSFWKISPNSNSKSSSPTQHSRSKAADQPRTGWLHNTESKVEELRKDSSSSSSSSPSRSSSPGGKARRTLEIAMKQQSRNHRILQPATFHAADGHVVVVTQHRISVPVYRNQPADSSTSTKRIDVYFCVAEKLNQLDRPFWQSLESKTPSQRATAYIEWAAMDTANDMVVYLQGGPGFGAPAPIVSLGLTAKSSWAGKALDKHYKRVVLMDQRGTGRSTPITKQTLEMQFPDLFLMDQGDFESSQITTAEQLVEALGANQKEAATRVQTAVTQVTNYVAQFRADNIVQDAEEVRDTLLLPDLDRDVNDLSARQWGCALGQSFGGFCMMTYLSQVQDPPQICLLTGGIAPMCTHVDSVYDSLWNRVQKRCMAYYDMYPEDVALVKLLVRKLQQAPAPLPAGGTLTARRLLQLGLGLGGGPAAFASIHALLESALVPNGNSGDDNDADAYDWSRAFLKRIESDQNFDDHPIYFWLHESIYANAGESAPTNWSAHRMYENKPAAFDYRKTCTDDSQPTLFFGEMVFPWMVDDYAELRGTGLRLMAHALASKTDWGPLYNPDRMANALENGKSVVAAAVYYDDLYVDFNACEAVLAGPLQKAKPWITNEYQHSGLRDSGAAMFDQLHGMATGSVRIPS